MKELRERQYEALERAVAALEPQDRFLISAFYEEGRSIADLEQITGMTQANVKVRLFRCRNRLARMLKIGGHHGKYQITGRLHRQGDA